MPKFVSVDLGDIQTTAFVPSDTNPPFWQLAPDVILLEHNRIQVRATGYDNESALLSYTLVHFAAGNAPTATDILNGAQGDGTPLIRSVSQFNVPRNQAVTLEFDDLEGDTIYNVAMMLGDGRNYILHHLGGRRTPEGPPTRFNFRQSGDCQHPDWLPFILPFALGVPEQFVFQQLGEVLEDFCDRTRLWREYVEIPAIKDQEGYEIPLPDGKQIVQFEDAPSIDGLQFASRDEAALMQAGQPRGYMRDENRVIFLPAPNKDGTVRFHISFKPTHDAVSCPKFLFADWRDAVVDGVLARLLNMVGPKDAPYQWTNPGESEMRRKKYLRACARGAATRRQKGDGSSYRASGPRVKSSGGYVDHRYFA